MATGDKSELCLHTKTRRGKIFLGISHYVHLAKYCGHMHPALPSIDVSQDVVCSYTGFTTWQNWWIAFGIYDNL